ncbi:uncharacterized protein N7473_010790 [Penicillium subrubescens]|uniref:uncharacterized protein n=1 Tax=Penicillium subrubescens TaxID=1316194 RepID=UPI002545A1C5|nr:uncharacterized protein N7473_010790 [Penicillium subrubescens]KAJ5883904.1 hypothetical protein N7473_010790 [Penicillium subrubescens]
MPSLDEHLGIDVLSSLYLRILAWRLTQGQMKSMICALSHENLVSRNIYIDENLNLTVFIGWELVKFMPIRFAMRFPSFLDITSKQQPRDLPVDPKEFSKKYLKVPTFMTVDRGFYVSPHDCLVGCLPECLSGKIEEIIPQRDLYLEVWDIFRQHVPRKGFNQRAKLIAPFLYQALNREQDWEDVEARLRQAIGRPRPSA